MMVALHKNACTTRAVRQEIAASGESASVLAARYGVTQQTINKWKHNHVFTDLSHTAHRLRMTLSPAQEIIVVHLRRTLLLPLANLLAFTRELLCPTFSRSRLDRCLERHGASNLQALKPQAPPPAYKPFKHYEPGYVHVDIKVLQKMPHESARRYLFVVIDRATHWVFIST